MMKMTNSNKAKRRRLTYPDWSNLHVDLLELILKKLSPIKEVLRFRAVCSSWRSIAETHIASSNSSPLIQPPCLLLPSNFQKLCDNVDSDSYDHRQLCLSSLGEKKSHEFEINNPNLSCVGSSNGWLVYLDEKNNKTPHLFNPFLGLGIRLCNFLPTLSLRITKVVLWSDPILSHNNYAIVGIHDLGFRSKLAYAKCGDCNWTDLSGSHNGCYCDVITFGDNVCALSDIGSVEIWDFKNCYPTKKMFLRASIPKESVKFENRHLFSSQFYIVESLGELLLVVRYIGNFVDGYDGQVVHEADFVDGFVYPYMTKMFYVYKLNYHKGKWEKVESLGDRAMFLGGNHSVTVSVGDFPRYERNSIYFTDDSWDRMDEHYDYGGHDMGVFNLGDFCIKGIFEVDLDKIQPPPLWVIPNSSSM